MPQPSFVWLTAGWSECHRDPGVALLPFRHAYLHVVIGHCRPPVVYRQRTTLAARLRRPEAPCEFGPDLTNRRAATANGDAIHLVAKRRRLGSGTIGVREYM